MKYQVILAPGASDNLKQLLTSEPAAYRKALALIAELYDHPRTGTGHPEPLKGQPAGRWSRRITRKHRLVYRILDAEVYVYVLSAYGHYEDK